MNAIQKVFENKLDHNLSIFFTAGFPNLDDTNRIIHALSENEVDFIEVGLPYSDPLADGPTIQYSSARALSNGVNLDVIFQQLEEIKDTNQTPLVLMGYINQIIQYGEEDFCAQVQKAGIDTIIIPDMPISEYENHYQALLSKYGISNVFLITPQTSDERIRKIDTLSDAFIYMVASSSITGAKGTISQAQIDYFTRIQAMNLQNKLIIGFGISNAETYNIACSHSNGVIIGSAFIQHLDKYGVEGVADFIESIR